MTARSTWWKSALGIAVSALFIWWALRSTPLDDVARVLRASHVRQFLAAAAVATCIFPLRALRWRPILEPVAGRLPFGPLWRATAIGMMMNNVFPLRPGEVGRAYALTREASHVAFPTALGSLAVDRIFDAIVVFGLMFGAMMDPRFPQAALIGGRTVTQLAAGGMVLVIALLVVCYAMVWRPEATRHLVGTVARRVMPRFSEAIVRLVDHGVGGLAVLTDGRRFALVLWWAVVHWLVHALALAIGFGAVGIDVPWSAALFLQGVLTIGVAVPSSPGFVGVFETSAMLGLGVYGVPRDLAVSWAIGYHLLSFIPITLMGAYWFTRLGLTRASMDGSVATSTAGRMHETR